MWDQTMGLNCKPSTKRLTLLPFFMWPPFWHSTLADCLSYSSITWIRIMGNGHGHSMTCGTSWSKFVEIAKIYFLHTHFWKKRKVGKIMHCFSICCCRDKSSVSRSVPTYCFFLKILVKFWETLLRNAFKSIYHTPKAFCFQRFSIVMWNVV